MIFNLSNKSGYSNFLSTHSNWLRDSLDEDVRDTKRAKDYKTFVDKALEGQEIIMAGDELGVNDGEDYEPYVGDIENGYDETHVDIHRLINKLNNRSDKE